MVNYRAMRPLTWYRHTVPDVGRPVVAGRRGPQNDVLDMYRQPSMPRHAVRRTLVRTALVLFLAAALPARAIGQPAAPRPRRLDGPVRARLLSALAGLVLLGLGMIALVWLGARITQRYRHSVPFFRPTPRPGEHDWARKPLLPPPHERSSGSSSKGTG